MPDPLRRSALHYLLAAVWCRKGEGRRAEERKTERARKGGGRDGIYELDPSLPHSSSLSSFTLVTSSLPLSSSYHIGIIPPARRCVLRREVVLVDAGDHADEVILNINGGAPAIAEFGGPLSGEVHPPITSSLSHFTRREGGGRRRR